MCIGYDTRFGSRSFARVAAEGANAGIPWRWDRRSRPPALSYAVRGRKAAGGVMITSSPIRRSGTREVQGELRGSGSPSIMASIESISAIRYPTPRSRRRSQR